MSCSKYFQRSRLLAAGVGAWALLSPGATQPAAASPSLEPVAFLPDHHLSRMTRSVAQDQLGRELFSDPAGTALIGFVDVFDSFPYVVSRYVQLVTDAGWDRVLYGEPGGDILAFDGGGSAIGALSTPLGIDRDARGRIFVADSGNDRVVVLELRGERSSMRLVPLYTIDGLSRPAGVAWDGGETPLDPADDCLWVADTGNHRIVCLRLGDTSAELVASYGERGNRDGQFLEPRDVEVGRADGAHSGDVYVADWGNGRLVHLARHGNDGLVWRESRRVGADVRRVSADAWGNLYAAVRGEGVIVKLDRQLQPLLTSDASFPGVRDVSVGFLKVTDHRSGEESFAGQGSLTVLEAWSSESGARRLQLGAEALELTMHRDGHGTQLDFLLTDHADVTVRVYRGDALVRDARLGELAAGRRSWSWDGLDEAGGPVDAADADAIAFEVVAASRYAGVPAGVTRTTPATAPPRAASLAAAWPNPINPSTSIRFFVPDGNRPLELDVIDVHGRVRSRLLTGALAAGDHQITWDGRDHAGRPVASGTYFVRLRVGDDTMSRKLTVVR